MRPRPHPRSRSKAKWHSGAVKKAVVSIGDEDNDNGHFTKQILRESIRPPRPDRPLLISI